VIAVTSPSPEENLRTRQQEAAGSYDEQQIAMYLARLETAERIMATVPAICERFTQLAGSHQGGLLRIVLDGDTVHPEQACWRAGDFQDVNRRPMFVVTSQQKMARLHHFGVRPDQDIANNPMLVEVYEVAAEQDPRPDTFYSTITADQLAMWQLGTSWQKMHAELRDLLAAMQALATPPS